MERSGVCLSVSGVFLTRCLENTVNTVLSVSHIFSIETKTKEKT